MPRSRLATVGIAVGLLLLIAVGAFPVGPLPPLGGFLDPWRGAWSVAAVGARAPGGQIALAGLGAPVAVRVDDRGVPHVFAHDGTDAMRALGYLVARDRLFQLEIQTRATAGRLTEWAGPRALDLDRQARTLGLAWAADRSWAAQDTSSPGYRAAVAYAEGVNTWIDAMGARDLPLEYRLLGVKPMRWEPRYSAYLMARMGYTLAYTDTELDRLRLAALVGPEAAAALLPLDNPIQEPIQPNGADHPRYDFHPLPPPGAPDNAQRLALDARAGVRSVLEGLGGVRENSGDALGSNNWAVAPTRAANGFALLAGDPHLDLTLPSIWYEAHLASEDGLDVAGVTIPGSPGIIIGFNRDIAWTFTNTGSDVMDFYRETVDDPQSPRRYRLDGTWRDLTLREETYHGTRGEVLLVDTVRTTHRGPLLRVDGGWLSLRWTVHDVSQETDVFQRLNRARSVDEWLEAMERYESPTQNGLVADRAGTIAIRSTGRYPIRPAAARGDTVLDGSRRANDWTGSLPISRYPFSRNPAQGFLASANQQPVDPRVEPAYLGANWFAPWRALRINTLLRANGSVTPDAMRRFQTDPGSARVAEFLPFFLAAARRADSAGAADTALRRAATLLMEWDGRYTRDNTRAILFELAMDELNRGTWDELIIPGGSRPLVTPDGSVLRMLLDDPASAWWDRRATATMEDRQSILIESLLAGYRRAVAEFGDPSGEGWRWDGIRFANIRHLLGLPGLSALRLPVQGGPSTLAPSSGSGTHGASWRMVVEMGPEVRAWGIYPGGQSGNPSSRFYADRITRWQAGELDTLLFPKTPDELSPTRMSSSVTFVPRP